MNGQEEKCPEELAVSEGYTVDQPTRSYKGEQVDDVEEQSVVCKVEPSKHHLDLPADVEIKGDVSQLAQHLRWNLPLSLENNQLDSKDIGRKREQTPTNQTTCEEPPNKKATTQRRVHSTTSLHGRTTPKSSAGTSEGIRARLRDVLTHRSCSVGTQTVDQVPSEVVEHPGGRGVPFNTSMSIVKGDIRRLIEDAKTDYHRYEALMHSSQYRITTLEGMLGELTNMEGQMKQSNAPRRRE